MQLDRYDRQILEILQREGRISNQDLADRIGLSASPCLRRVRSLEESGFITAYRALLDSRKLGLSLMALIHISMDQHTPEDKTRMHTGHAGNARNSVEQQFLVGVHVAHHNLQLVIGVLPGNQQALQHFRILGDLSLDAGAVPRRGRL